jgi:hypothetical protein
MKHMTYFKNTNKRNSYYSKYDEIFNNQKNNTKTQNPKVETVHNANEKEKKPKSSKFEIAPLILGLMILAYVGGSVIFYSAQYKRIGELNNLIRQEEKRSTGSGLLDIYRYERTSLTYEVDPLKFFYQKP